MLGPPTLPNGPLEVKDIMADSAVLSWAKPDDNGGDEILNYIVEKLDTRTGDWEKVGLFDLFCLFAFEIGSGFLNLIKTVF